MADHSRLLRIAAKHVGVAAAVDDGNDPEWFFIRCVGDQILANANEAQRAGRKVRACVAALGKCDQASNGFVNVLAHASRSKRVIGGDVFPDLGDILGGKRVKGKAWLTGH